MEANTEIDQLIWDMTHQTPAIDWLAFEDPGQLFCEINPLDHALCTNRCAREIFRRDPRDPENPAKPLRYEKYTSLPEHIRSSIAWHRLILCRSPLGETSRKLLTALGLCGQDIASNLLPELRQALESEDAKDFTARCMTTANLSAAGVRVNFLNADTKQAKLPKKIDQTHILPVLGFEETFENWEESCAALKDKGLPVKKNVDKPSAAILLENLTNLIRGNGYAAMSARLFPAFGTSSRKSPAYKIIHRCLLPIASEMGIPLILRPGYIPGQNALTNLYSDCDFDWLIQMRQEFPKARLIIGAGTPAQAHTLCQLSQLYPGVQVAATSELCSSEILALYENIIGHCGIEPLAYLSCANSPLSLTGSWAHLRWDMGKLLQKCYSDLGRTGWIVGKEELAEDLQIILNNNGESPVPTAEES